jgi:hypothetical protein
MAFQWPSDLASGFGRRTFRARHDLHESALFSDEGLAELLDTYPRDRLGVYRFPPHGEGVTRAAHGRAPGIAGKDLLKAVREGEIWLNLRAVNRELPAFRDVEEAIFGSIEQAAGLRTRKRDVGVLISSPRVQVHYHLDIPLVCLVQLRGTKRLYLYPTGAPYAGAEQVEAIALRLQDEELAFETGFEDAAEMIELQPGMALTWPQNAPHRVENADCLNVSLSCEFMTLPALVRANALYTNGQLRRRLGLKPGLPGGPGPASLGKAALARGLKLVSRPPDAAPTPITFEVRAGSGEIAELHNA